MGLHCIGALQKSLRLFGANAQAATAAIQQLSPTGDPTSCNLTMWMLANTLTQGRNLQSHDKQLRHRNTGAFNPDGARDLLETLFEGDDAILVSISPDHHFTLLPLADQIGLLQGFQGVYSLHDWIANGTFMRDQRVFLRDFGDLFSATASVATDAAVSLFATQGTEDDIETYFDGKKIYMTTVTTGMVGGSPS